MNEISFNHTQIVEQLNKKFENTGCKRFEYLDTIPEIQKKNKKNEFNFLFNWDSVNDGDNEELIDFLIETKRISSSLDVSAKKNKNKITVTVKEKIVSLKINEEKHSVIIESQIGDLPKYYELDVQNEKHSFPISIGWKELSKINKDTLFKFLKERKKITFGPCVKIKKNSSNKTLIITEKEKKFFFILNEANKTVILHNNHTKEKNRFYYKIENGMKSVYEKQEKYLINPNLPIDLICVYEKDEFDEEKQKNEKCYYYSLFFVASTNDIPKSLEEAILFYKFYLSRIISLKRFEIILVLSNQTDISTENKTFFKEYGIGLWKYHSFSSDPEIIRPSVVNRQKMSADFNEKKPKRKNIPLFFEEYIGDAVDGLVGFRPEQFGQCFVDRKILGKIFELEKISYRTEVSDLVNEHLTEKNDEYEFASEVFSSLWSSHIGVYYSDFLEIFEPSLQYIFADKREKQGSIYRDHYLHQLQVFLLGLPIIDAFWEDFKSNGENHERKKYENPEICWLITSSFHDMGYPVQKYDKWSEDFLNDVFKIESKLGSLELKSNFIDEHFLYCLGYLFCELHCTHLDKGQDPKPYWMATENEHLQFFYQQIVDKKNHGMMSSVSLLKTILFTSDNEDVSNITKIEKKCGNFEKFLKNALCPSALAIALHDSNIWKGEYTYHKKIKKVATFIKNIKFIDDPLSFLLIFCDTIQEWGRPNIAIELETDKKAKKFYLEEFEIKAKKVEGNNLIEKGLVKITLWTPNADRSNEFFKRKVQELEKVKKFLIEPDDIQFEIILKDNKGEKHPPLRFEMDGL